jgi:hypothetical protein
MTDKRRAREILALIKANNDANLLPALELMRIAEEWLASEPWNREARYFGQNATGIRDGGAATGVQVLYAMSCLKTDDYMRENGICGR